MISVSCTCGRRFKAEDHHAGKRTRCPVCGNLLVIGPAVAATPSGVNDNGEVPSWWFPTQQTPKSGSVPPTRSGSNPDDIQTVVMPPSQGSRVDPPRAPAPVPAPAGAAHPSPALDSGSKILIGLLSGISIAAIAGLAYVTWFQPENKVGQPQAPPTNQAKVEPATEGTAKPAAPDEGRSVAGGSNDRIGIHPAPAPAPPTAKSVPRTETADRLQLLVPAYFYPGGPGLRSWQRLIEAADKIPIVVIANPGNGPGDQSNPDYGQIIQAARDKGLRVIGYIATDYTNRPRINAEHEIERWIDFYPQINGFFFDQQAFAGSSAEYYAKLRDHARKRIKDALIVTNPGALCDEEYFARGVADLICIFANFQGFFEFEPPAPIKQFGPTRIAALVNNIPDAATMQKVVKAAVDKHIGYLYVGDAPQAAGNPYEKLPAYWDQLVEELANPR